MDCLAEKQPEWLMEKKSFFNLAEAEYKIKLHKMSKSDPQHIWSSDSSSESSLRQSLFNCRVVCFGEQSF